MADFEGIIKQHVGEDGGIPATAITTIVAAIKQAVGNEYVEKERYKAKLTEIDALKESKQTAEDNATTAEKWKTKHDALKAEFEEYKQKQAAAEDSARRSNAYRSLLKKAGVADKRIDAIIKVTDLAALEVDEKGEAKDSDNLLKKITEEWSEFIPTQDTVGAKTPTPPANNGGETGQPSRAAQMAKQYMKEHYGAKED